MDWTDEARERLLLDAEALDGCPVSFDKLAATTLSADIRAALGELREWRETARSEMAGRRAAEAKLAAWEAAESLPDCPACAVLEGE